MQLSPHEQERLLSYAAEVARRRRGRGLRLNHPEAVALICDHVLEGARDGVTVAQLMDAVRLPLPGGWTATAWGDELDGVCAALGRVPVPG